jgi:cytochrome c-type biogenesis protein
VAESPSIALALAAGFVSFASPCCLPLVPGYLATVCGRPVEGHGFDSAVVARSLVFVAGFSAVFILLGLGATAIGAFLFDNQVTLRRAAVVAIAGLGLLFLASAFVTALNRDWRPPGLIERAGHGGPLLAGAAFALAWTPCVGPTLGAILGLASTEQSTLAGAGLLAVYSAGLAIPFLLTAIGFSAAQRSFAWVKRHYRAIQIASGTVLVAMGVLVYTNELFRLNIEAQRFLDQFGLNFFQEI